jgi:nucleoside-diphosphate-sugar epimerase
MTTTSLRFAITGGSGYVGTHLVQGLRNMGHQVTLLARRPPPGESHWIPFTVGSAPPSGALRDFDVLVHAAYDFSAPDLQQEYDRNVSGSAALFRAAATDGVARILNISSLSAFDGCVSHYGRIKLHTEEKAAERGGTSIRLGFVCDESERGLSGALKRLVRQAPVVPLPWPGTQSLFTFHARGLAAAFLALTRANHLRGRIVSLAHPRAASLREMLTVFAQRQERRVFFLPVPWRLMWLPLRTAEMMGLRSGFRSDSLVSLMNQNPTPDFSLMHQTGITPARFDSDA